ncbi:MAG: ATP-binding cassette domain-containing protein, partial [Candidatus Bathyarchaeia archaeon]
RQTAREYLEFEGRFWCIPKQVLKEKIPKLLKFLELEEWADEIPIKFSSGMKRRLQLARVLLRNTPIMLLDEPTVSLDPSSAWTVREYLKRTAKEEEKTIVLATHYMLEAEYCCDTIAFINHGRIIGLGSPDELKKKVVEYDIVKVAVDKVPQETIIRFRGIEDVISISVEKDTQVSPYSIIFSLKKDSTLIPEIVKEITKANSRIYEVSKTQPTMEDVFRRLGEVS